MTELLPISGILASMAAKEPGPRVVVLAAVHGTEPCGVRAFERVLPKLTLARGSATFVIGNPAALAKGVRFIDANLNRLFREDTALSEAQKASYEYARSRELMPLLRSADAVLDIHSSESPECEPFVICGNSSRKLAKQLPFPILSWGWDAIEPGGTDDFVERDGKIGICVECGYNGDPSAIERAEAAILRFLSLLGLIDPLPAWEVPQQRQLRATYAHMAATDFTPIRMVPDFAPVAAGTLIGTDGGREMRAEKDGFLIFVRKREGPGQEAYIFAEDAAG